MQGKLLGFWHEQLMMVQLTGMKKPGKGEQHVFFGGGGADAGVWDEVEDIRGPQMAVWCLRYPTRWNMPYPLVGLT